MRFYNDSFICSNSILLETKSHHWRAFPSFQTWRWNSVKCLNFFFSQVVDIIILRTHLGLVLILLVYCYLLQFLSVAQNKLKSLSMSSQPRLQVFFCWPNAHDLIFSAKIHFHFLQVLAASKNKISTLKGFPYLPALEVCWTNLNDYFHF